MNMGLTAKAGANIEFKQIAPGTYTARCVKVIDLGTHEREYMGEKKDIHEVMIGFEFPTELEVFDEEKGEQTFFSAKYFTLSLSEKANLRKFLENWRGKNFTEEELKGFDLTQLIGATAMVNIIEVVNKKGEKRNVIGSASSLIKGMEVPDQINESITFSFEDFDEELLNKLGQKTQEKIKSSKEYLERENVNTL